MPLTLKNENPDCEVSTTGSIFSLCSGSLSCCHMLGHWGIELVYLLAMNGCGSFSSWRPTKTLELTGSQGKRKSPWLLPVVVADRLFPLLHEMTLQCSPFP